MPYVGSSKSPQLTWQSLTLKVLALPKPKTERRTRTNKQKLYPWLFLLLVNAVLKKYKSCHSEVSWRKMLYLERFLPRVLVEEGTVFFFFWWQMQAFPHGGRFYSVPHWTQNFIHVFKSVFTNTRQTSAWSQVGISSEVMTGSLGMRHLTNVWREPWIRNFNCKLILSPPWPHIILIFSFPTDTNCWYWCF